MKVTIDEDILKKHGLSIEEFMVLYLSAKEADITTINNRLVKRKFGELNLLGQLIIPNETKDFIAEITIDSEKSQAKLDYSSLATKLREIYPKGSKAGTSYSWRGSVAEIARKLKTLEVKYNFFFTEEDALSATKRYVESFNGNYTYMKLLKYFILKTARDADGNVELSSEFMSLIENKDSEVHNVDWDVCLR